MIIYFSGTGNCLKIAKALGEHLKEDVVPLKEARNDASERLIFIFPTYCFEMPPNVKEVIKHFIMYKYQIIMGISVSAGMNGNSEYTFNQLIEGKGLKVTAFVNVAMADNVMPILLGKESNYVEADIEQIIEKLSEQNYRNEAKYKKIYRLGSRLMFGSGGKKFLKKKVKEEKCIGCGLCKSVCPNNNITVYQSKAHIHDRCVECFACMNWCPTQAIYIRKPIEAKMQYRNPDINPQELNQSIKHLKES